MEMTNEREGKTLFESSLAGIERVIDFIAARHRLEPDARDDFYSYVMLKLIDDDYRRIREFRGESRLETYLTVVVQRLFLDFRAQNWGSWCSSTRARALGEPALLIERMIYRDGLARSETRRALEARGYYIEPDEFEALMREIPYRPRRRHVTADVLDALPDGLERGRLSAGERALAGERFESALAVAAGKLSAEDRLLLKLRFVDGCPMQVVARALGRRQRPLYARVQRLLRRLRRSLEENGLDRSEAQAVWSERVEIDIESALRHPSGSVNV